MSGWAGEDGGMGWFGGSQKFYLNARDFYCASDFDCFWQMHNLQFPKGEQRKHLRQSETTRHAPDPETVGHLWSLGFSNAHAQIYRCEPAQKNLLSGSNGRYQSAPEELSTLCALFSPSVLFRFRRDFAGEEVEMDRETEFWQNIKSLRKIQIVCFKAYCIYTNIYTVGRFGNFHKH